MRSYWAAWEDISPDAVANGQDGTPTRSGPSLLTIALALALATLAGLQAIGGNGVLGAFVAGAVLNDAVGGDHEEHQEHFNEAVARFFDLPIMFLLGAALPWHDWYTLGWHGAAFAVSILLLRRLPAWLLLGGLMSWSRQLLPRLFAGWFGSDGRRRPVLCLRCAGTVSASRLCGPWSAWPSRPRWWRTASPPRTSRYFWGGARLVPCSAARCCTIE